MRWQGRRVARRHRRHRADGRAACSRRRSPASRTCLDPATSQIYTGAQVYDNIFSKLIDIDETSKFYGVLATKWKQTDAKTWVFDLVPTRRSTTASRSPPTTSSTPSSASSTPRPRAATRRCTTSIDSSRGDEPTPGRSFHLKSPFGPFLTNLANNGEIVNQKAIESQGPGAQAGRHRPVPVRRVGAGRPHHAEEASPATSRRASRRSTASQFRFLLVDQSRIDALHSGELDWVDAVPLQQLADAEERPALHATSPAPLAGIPDYLAMNVRRPPFDNLAVRQAVAWASTARRSGTVAYFGAGEAGCEEVPTGSTLVRRR